MPDSDGRTSDSIRRRRVLQALGVGTAAGLAGCGGGDGGDGGGGDGGDGGGSDGSDGGGSDGGDGGSDGGSGDLGERVPTLSMEYWSNLGGQTTIMENTAPQIKQDIEENLGVTLEVVPVEFTTQINNTIQDKRTHHMSFWYHTSTPDRLDPEEMTRRYSADWAGGNGQANPANYADCEFTDMAVGQGRAPDPDEREGLVHDAHAHASEDLYCLQLFPTALFGDIRTDQIEPAGIGEAGVVRTNPHFFIQSEPKGDLTQAAAVDTPVAMETSNYPIIDSSAAQTIWNHLIHSTLTEYDENLELQNVLADTVEIENDAQNITVELKDATFHNGDPVTAEDVKFTYLQLANNPGVYPQASSPPYDEIVVVDEKTAEFRMEESFLPLVQKVWPRWGIMHKQTWVDGGAQEEAEAFEMDEIIGSGPFAMRNFTVGESMDMVPHDGHPVHSPNFELFLQAFRNQQTAVQAFSEGEVQLAPNLTPGTLERINNNAGDVAETYERPGILHFTNYPQMSWSPSQFREFRAAWGAAINRQQATTVGIRDAVDPSEYSCILSPTHPFRPPEDMLTQMAPAEGDPEAAQAALTDAGWGFDDQDRLHYPPDKDLSPRWPAEETPDPGEFPCVGEEGEYVGPDER
jgi:peptide/nickel transport system substrate-binding protein